MKKAINVRMTKLVKKTFLSGKRLRERQFLSGSKKLTSVSVTAQTLTLWMTCLLASLNKRNRTSSEEVILMDLTKMSPNKTPKWINIRDRLRSMYLVKLTNLTLLSLGSQEGNLVQTNELPIFPMELRAAEIANLLLNKRGLNVKKPSAPLCLPDA
jgi:hypothetical protein